MSSKAAPAGAAASPACIYLDIGIQVISGIVGAGMCVLAGFGFDQLHRRAQDEEVKRDQLPSQSDFYSGVTLLYLFLMGLLTILGEIRLKDINNSVLRPFGFMHSYVGRAFFYAFVGSFLIAIDTSTLCQVTGGLLFGICFAQIMLSVFGPRYLLDKEQANKGDAIARATFASGNTQGSADISSGAPGSEYGGDEAGASATTNPLNGTPDQADTGDVEEGGVSEQNPFA